MNCRSRYTIKEFFTPLILSCILFVIGMFLPTKSSYAFADSSWNIVSSPTPGNSSILNAVTSISSSDVWAVGYDWTTNANPIALHWNGSSWGNNPVSNSYLGSYLLGVSAISSSNVLAVGYSQPDNGSTSTFSMYYNGSVWSTLVNESGGTNSAYLAVGSDSAGDAWAVGTTDVDGITHPLIERYQGSAIGFQNWLPSGATVFPNVPGSTADVLTAVTVHSLTDAWAVGYYRDTSNNVYPLTYHWDGTSWINIVAPSPSGGSYTKLFGVTAISANDVWAVGSSILSINGITHGITYIVHWDGSVWSIIESPSPSQSNDDALYAVSASSSNEVYAVGYTRGPVAAQARHPLILKYNGSTWQQQEVPDPISGNIDNLTGVSSIESGEVWAVGGSQSSTLTLHSTQTSLPAQAASLAKIVVGADYLWGGKGWDVISKLFVNSPQIFQGYNYWNNDLGQTVFDNGLDCSGLVLWSYNKAFGATNYLNGNPIQYEGADGQYRYNSQDVSESDLQPGDLLFFDFAHSGSMDHVAMYAGDLGDGNDVIEAAQPGIGIIKAKKSDLKQLDGFIGFRRQKDPQVGLKVQSHSPVSLVVTDPDRFSIDADTHRDTPFEHLREIPGQLYYTEENGLDDTVIAPTLKTGSYIIKVKPKTNALPTETYSLDVKAGDQTITLASNIAIKDIPSEGYGVTSVGSSVTSFIPVTINMRPLGQKNTINPKSKGKVPVAILSSATFNAPGSVDKTSLTFGRSGDEKSLAYCNPDDEEDEDGLRETICEFKKNKQTKKKPFCYTKDINKDKFPDLICYFNIQQTGFQSGDTQGILKGKTIDGTVLRGVDTVRIVH